MFNLDQYQLTKDADIYRSKSVDTYPTWSTYKKFACKYLDNEILRMYVYVLHETYIYNVMYILPYNVKYYWNEACNIIKLPDLRIEQNFGISSVSKRGPNFLWTTNKYICRCGFVNNGDNFVLFCIYKWRR